MKLSKTLKKGLLLGNWTDQMSFEVYVDFKLQQVQI